MDDWQGRYLDKLDRDISEIKVSMRATEQRVEATVSSALDQIRHLDNQRRDDLVRIGDRFEKTQSAIEEQLQKTEAAVRSESHGTMVAVWGMLIAIILGGITVVITIGQLVASIRLGH
jgi:hypothetical protein